MFSPVNLSMCIYVQYPIYKHDVIQQGLATAAYTVYSCHTCTCVYIQQNILLVYLLSNLFYIPIVVKGYFNTCSRSARIN